MHNLSKSAEKLGYVYLLTPVGLVEKSKPALGFLKQKKAGYEALQRNIEKLRMDLVSADLGLGAHSRDLAF